MISSDYEMPDLDYIHSSLEKIVQELQSINSNIENLIGYMPDMADATSLNIKLDKLIKLLERIERK